MNEDALEIDVAQASQARCAGWVLVDIREPEELADGMAAGARHIRRSELDTTPSEYFPDTSTRLMLICASGNRSLHSARHLREQGYLHVVSVAGGFRAWRHAGLSEQALFEDPDARDFHQRYARHLRLPQVGEAGQRKLLASTVSVIGAGGLGSPVLFYLAAAGVGRIRIIDGDRVDRSNLQRQILHREQDIGSAKTASAARALTELNPRIHLDIHQERLSAANARRLLAGSDVVVDATDNFPTRYLISDTCAELRIPWVYAAIHRFEGQITVFDNRESSPIRATYRCLFPESGEQDQAPNCSEAGVLGVLPGIVGSMQASEVLKLLLGIGQPLIGRLLHIDALNLSFHESRYRGEHEGSDRS